MIDLCDECAETGDLCEACDQALADEWSKATCVACGHTRFDHPDRNMGARSNDDWLCHEDDHSCYAPAASSVVS